MPNSSRRDTVELRRPRVRLNLLLLIPAVAVLSAAGIFANPGTVVSMASGARPTKIESDTISLDKADQSALYTGHVHLQNFAGDACDLSSDSLKVNFTTNLQDIRSATASGNVRVDRGPLWLGANDAVLDSADHTMVMTGSPALHNLNGATPANKIIVHLDTGQIEMD
jgi:lipopolysaccharide export system protein LptA